MEKYDEKYHKSRFYWLWRIFILWLGASLGFMLMAHLNLGLTIDTWEKAFIAAAVVGILNALLWPILSRILMPFIVITVGIGALLINAAFVWIASDLIGGITVGGPALILTPIAMAAISIIMITIASIDDDAAWYQEIRVAVKKVDKREVKTKPGVIFMEIDGLAKNVLLEAIEKGYLPTLKEWIDSGSHKISGWETDLSSQTSASQAGLLHGNNEDIVAFRWVEKEKNNKFMVSTGLTDAPIVEKRISNGKGLLSFNGASRANLFSGDAEDVMFTFSKLKSLGGFYSIAWNYVYYDPSYFSRIVCLFFWDALLDYKSQIMHRIKDIKPRIYRGITYPFIRAGANIFLREVTTLALTGDILKGQVDVEYVTYLGYDEIAHHSGVRDEDAFQALRGLDKQFKRIEIASHLSYRDYHLVIHSDHGQTNGATFKQRYRKTLEDVVRELLPAETKICADMSSSSEDHFELAFKAPGVKVKKFFKDKTDSVNDYVQYVVKPDKTPETETNVMVLASGNLGMVYLTDFAERLNYEDINLIYSDLIPGLAKHEGIGFILVNSNIHGPLVIGNNGTYYLKENKFEGENPLANFGPNAVEHLCRTNRFKYTPDVLVMSLYDPEINEVAAFEELVGSHGGIGGEQSFPFILHPSSWDIEDGMVGAEKVHQAFKEEILNLIQEDF